MARSFLFTVLIFGMCANASASSSTIVSTTTFAVNACWESAPCTATIPSTTAGNTLVLISLDSNTSSLNTYVSTATGATFSIVSNTTTTDGSHASNLKVQVATSISSGITAVTYGGFGVQMNLVIFEITSGSAYGSTAAVTNANAHANPQSAGSVTVTNESLLLFFCNMWFAGDTGTFTWIAPASTGGQNSGNTASWGQQTNVAASTVATTFNSSSTGGNIVGVSVAFQNTLPPAPTTHVVMSGNVVVSGKVVAK